jgi:hypothetical protein
MSRLRRNLLPAVAVFAGLLLAAPASALPAFSSTESGWTRILEPLLRLAELLTPAGGAPKPRPADAVPSGRFAPEGWAIDPNSLVISPPTNQGANTPPNV